jgi:hypothetical protein
VAVDGCALFQKRYKKKVSEALDLLFKHLSSAKPGVEIRVQVYESLLDGWQPKNALRGEDLQNWREAFKNAGYGGAREQSLLFALDSLLRADLPEGGKSVLVFASGPPLIPDGPGGGLSPHGVCASMNEADVAGATLILPDDKRLSASFKRWLRWFEGGLGVISLDGLVSQTCAAAELALWNALFGGPL